LAFVLVVVWALLGSYLHYSSVWQLLMNTLSAVVTFLMVFVLNNAQSRHTTAINAKLDSIIFAVEDADNRLIGLESKSESHAEQVLEEIKSAAEEA
jgi:low affinity Fe/Cu permease